MWAMFRMFVQLVQKQEEGKYVLNMENDILPGCVITHDGSVVNETIKNILEGGA